MALTAIPGGRAQGEDERSAYLDGLKEGQFDLAWLRDERVLWGARAELRDGVGLTLKATNKVEPYGRVEDVAPNRSSTGTSASPCCWSNTTCERCWSTAI
jgi:hypothetical protein